jgi:hypothetical protein
MTSEEHKAVGRRLAQRRKNEFANSINRVLQITLCPAFPVPIEEAMNAAPQKFYYDPSQFPSANPLPTKCGRREERPRRWPALFPLCYKSTLAPLFSPKRNPVNAINSTLLLHFTPTPTLSHLMVPGPSSLSQRLSQ